MSRPSYTSQNSWSDVEQLRAEEIDEITHGFYQFDYDHQGLITPEKIKSSLERAGIDYDDREVNRVFHNMDVHNRGQVTYQDYLKSMAHVYANPDLQHQHEDHNGYFRGQQYYDDDDYYSRNNYQHDDLQYQSRRDRNNYEHNSYRSPKSSFHQSTFNRHQSYPERENHFNNNHHSRHYNSSSDDPYWQNFSRSNQQRWPSRHSSQSYW